MAKKAAAGVNKSQAIRDALQENPGKPPREIAEMLVAKGLTVTPQYVSMIKSTSKTKGKGKKRTVKVRKMRKSSGGLGPFAAAIEFIRAAGGIAPAREALDAVEAIKNL